MLWFALVASTLAGCAKVGHDGASPGESVTVFGAASLTDALSEVGSTYHTLGRAKGHSVRFSFAATSTLARQIEAGAPAAIFASANASWMDYLQERNLIDADSRTSPLSNTLVLISGQDSAGANISLESPAELGAQLGATGRLAMGDPAHVPAGMYAEQALQTLGLWAAIEQRAVFANNVRGVLALVEHGEAPLGITYASDAVISPRVQVRATFPPDSHAPIDYSFALVAGEHNEIAADLLAFMGDAVALEIFRRHGFRAR